MNVRMGPNGMPIIKKDTIQEIAKVEKVKLKKEKKSNMIQEILEENPNEECCDDDGNCQCDTGEEE